MNDNKIIKFGKIVLAVMIIALAGNTLSIAIAVLIHLITAIIKLLYGIFLILGNTLKENMLFLALWIIVLSKIKMMPLKNVVYRSIVRIINPNEECLICFEN